MRIQMMIMLIVVAVFVGAIAVLVGLAWWLGWIAGVGIGSERRMLRSIRDRVEARAESKSNASGCRLGHDGRPAAVVLGDLAVA